MEKEYAEFLEKWNILRRDINMAMTFTILMYIIAVIMLIASYV